MKIIKIGESSYPSNLKKVKNPPQKLFAEGNTDLLNKNSLAIVGTRDPTDYGINIAQNFAKELSNEGICIVSGLADGIDSYAHMGAKSGKGKTIAVLGCGLKHIYPEHNLKLYQDILDEGGCVITEYKPDETYKPQYFPARNRIISGISMGVLVVEGRYRSGSGITARLAMEQKKEIFCIPNDITRKTAYVPNEFIKIGAHLVSNIQDILEYFPKQRESAKMSDEFLEIYKYMSKIPVSVDEICRLTNLSAASVNERLMLMEIEGLIKNVYGGYVVV